MPSYKNELTEQLILKSLQKKIQIKNEPYVQMETFYEILCQMVRENESQSGFNHQRIFDRQIFDEILQESELFKSGDNLLLKVESFIINIMRAEITLNEKLKSIHKSIQNLEEQLTLAQQKDRPANRFDQSFEKTQKLSKKLQQIKDQKFLTEKDLFSLRLTFIQQEELKRLVKKLQINAFSRAQQSQLSHVRISQNKNTKKSGPSLHSIGPDKKSPSKRIINPKPNDIIFAGIFLLTPILLLIQSAIAIFYRVSFLNLMLLGFIILMFLKQKYSKIELKAFLFVNGISILMDSIFLLLNKSYFWGTDSSGLFQGNQNWKFYVFVLFSVSFIGETLLEILLFVQILRQLPQQITLSLICFSFGLKQIQRPLREDIIHTTFAKIF